MWRSIFPFLRPRSANIERIAALGVNLVVGTTGWTEHADARARSVEKNGIGLVWSPNYSVGVNAFFRIVAEAAKLLSGAPEYEAWAWEIHHSAKKDAPSGTLLKLVEEMKRAGYDAPHRHRLRTARARSRARTRSASIRRPIRLRCGIRRAAAKASRTAR